jgi:hypothetical protein
VIEVFSIFTASPLTALPVGAGSFFWLLLEKNKE